MSSEPGEPVSFRASQWINGSSGSAHVLLDVWLPEGVGEGRPVHARTAVDGRDHSLFSGHVGDDLCEPDDCEIRIVDTCATLSLQDLPLRWGGTLTAHGERLCRSDVPPRGTLSVEPVPLADEIAPVHELGVRSSAPLDLASIASARLLADGRSIGVRYIGDAWVGRLELLEPVAPFGDLRVDVHGALDVSGQALTLETDPFGLTDAIDDLSLDTAPPLGAIVAIGTVVSWDREQGLAVPNIGRSGSGEMAVLLGLGEVPGRTLEVEATAQLREGGPLVACALRGLLLGACEPLELPVALEIPPGDGPLALVIARSEGSRSAVSISQISVLH